MLLYGAYMWLVSLNIHHYGSNPRLKTGCTNMNPPLDFIGSIRGMRLWASKLACISEGKGVGCGGLGGEVVWGCSPEMAESQGGWRMTNDSRRAMPASDLCYPQTGQIHSQYLKAGVIQKLLGNIHGRGVRGTPHTWPERFTTWTVRMHRYDRGG